MALGQSDPKTCDAPQGYIEVYKQFLTAWDGARLAGTLVDPELTDIAVWLVEYENRMVNGVPVAQLCREMIDLWAGSSLAEQPRACFFCKK